MESSKAKTALLEESQPEKMSPASIGLLASIFILIAVDAIAVWMISAFLPGWLDDHGLSSTWSGVIFAANSIAGLIATPLAALIIQATSNTAVLVSAPALVAAIQLLTGLVASHGSGDTPGILLIIFRSASGFVESIMFVAATSTILRIAPPGQGPTYLGMGEGIRALGIILGPLIGSPLYQLGGFYLPFVVAGILLGVVSIGLVMIIRRLPPDVKHSDEKGNTVKDLVSKVIYWQTGALLLTLLLAFIPGVIIQPILEDYLRAAPYLLSPSDIGILLGVLSVFDVLGAALSGPIAGMIGAFPVLFGSNAIAAIGCILLAFGPEKIAVVTLALAFSYLGGYPTGITTVIVWQRFCAFKGLPIKDYSELASTAINFAVYIAFSMSTIAGGALNDGIGFRHTFIVVLGLVLLIFPILGSAFNPLVLGGKLPPLDESTAAETKPTEEVPLPKSGTADCLSCKCA